MKSKSKLAGKHEETRNTAMLLKNPVWQAFAKRNAVSATTQTTIGLGARKALYALTHGDGAFEHFKKLLVTAYAGKYLAEKGYGYDLQGDFEEAVHALTGCLERARRGETFCITDSETAPVNQMLNLHEQQIQLADRATLSDAILESFRRISVALAADMIRRRALK